MNYANSAVYGIIGGFTFGIGITLAEAFMRVALHMNLCGH